MSNMKIDLTSLFDSDESFCRELISVSKTMEKIVRYKNKVLVDDKKLYEVLMLDQNISRRLEKLYVYSHFLNDLDLTNSKRSNNFHRVISLYVKYGNLASFLIPELLEEDFKYIKSLIANNDKLKEFENSLKEIFRNKRHVLSPEIESVVTSLSEINKGDVDALSKLVNFDTKFKDVNYKGALEDRNATELCPANYDVLLNIPDQKIRKEVFDNMYDKLSELNLTPAVLLNNIISYNNKVSNIKGYNSSLEHFLDKNNINPAIYDSMLKNIRSNLKSFDIYWSLKKKILKLKSFNTYDISVPIISDSTYYSYEEARDLVLGTSLMLGQEYSIKVNDIFKNNRIDADTAKNKKTIAYSTSAYDGDSYIFMNFNGGYKDTSTLAHEVGHAVHFQYAKENNSLGDYEPNIFVAEVASQVNELLLNKYMLKMAKSDNEKLRILEEKICDFESVIRRATMYADFEKTIHEYNAKGNSLTSDYLNNEYLKVVKKYYGREIIVDDKMKYEWIRISSALGKYYVYQYATGYVAALIIADDIYNKKDDALENYIKFLKAGKTKSPINLLKICNIDITNSKIYKNAFKMFENDLDEFENLYKSKEEINNE